MTQKETVLNHLQTAKLTQLEATMKYGILRLGAIINVLRKEGYEIITHTPQDKGNYAIYELLGKKIKEETKKNKPTIDISQTDMFGNIKVSYKGYWEEDEN